MFIMTLLDHLVELRRRLIFCFIAWGLAFILCYGIAEEIFFFLVKPLANLFSAAGQQERRLIYTGLTEAFTTYLKVAFFGGFILAFPFIATQVWFFVAPGLYQHEKRAFLPFLMATPVLFFLGAALAYYVVCPLAWQFFLSFEVPPSDGGLPIQLEARVSEYLSLVMKLIFAFGVCFQLPILLTLLAYNGTITRAQLQAHRKYAFLGIVIVCALITPPDLLSPISLIVPIYGLYELSIFLIKIVERRGLKDLCKNSEFKKEDT